MFKGAWVVEKCATSAGKGWELQTHQVRGKTQPVGRLGDEKERRRSSALVHSPLSVYKTCFPGPH